MEHGAAPAADAERWEISRVAAMKLRSSQNTDSHEHSWCDSATYAVIPKEAESFYQSILADVYSR